MGSRRTKRLRLALATGLIARAFGAIVQLVSLPIAAKALGHEGFVLYGSALALLGMLNLSQMGIGPAMAIELGSTLASGDRDRSSTLFVTSKILSQAIALFVGGAALTAFLVWPGLDRIFPSSSQGVSELLRCALLLLFFYGAAINLVVYENGQVAYQETHIANIVNIFGAATAAIGVILAAAFFPLPSVILLGVMGPSTLR